MLDTRRGSRAGDHGRYGVGRSGAVRRVLIAVGAAALSAMLAPKTVMAQAGYYFTPSLDVSEVYDDNVFGASQDAAQPPEDDFITRAGVVTEFGYRSTPFTLLAGYHVDGEIYADHSDLDQFPVRQAATADLEYLPTRRLTLSLTGGWSESENASELNAPSTLLPPAVQVGAAEPVIPPTSNLQVTRSKAWDATARPSASYLLDALTTATTNYFFSQNHYNGTDQQTGSTNLAHSTQTSLDRRFTPRDTGRVTYLFRYISSDQDQPDQGEQPEAPASSAISNLVRSHAFEVGWSRQLTPNLSFDVNGGPRFTQGQGGVDPEVHATVDYQFSPQLNASFTYARSQGTSVGVGGALETESFLGAVSYEPIRLLGLSVGGGYTTSTSDTRQNDVYSAFFATDYPLREWLDVIVSYRFASQNGDLGTAGTGVNNQDTLRNIVRLGLRASYPSRLF